MTLSKYRSGSLGELWSVSFPLMLSFLSVFVMVFVDRMYLAHYSTAALNASVKAGTFAWALLIGLQSLASIASVFVAQYNGAQRYKKIGEPVWQMLWLSVGSALIFFPLGFWGSKFFYGAGTLECLYFRAFMFSAPLVGLYNSTTAFFIGRGKTSIITKFAILGNGINIILDPLFIFGFKPYFPSLGIEGAVIATAIGIFVQFALLLGLFLSQENSVNFGSRNCNFNFSAFKSCLKIGISPAVFDFLELLSWAFFYHMMAMVSEDHISASSVCQSVIIPFYFFCLGLEKGTAAVAGNLIGAGKTYLIYNVLKNALKLIALFMIPVTLLFFIFPNLMISCFVDINEIQGSMKSVLDVGLILMAIYIFFEALRFGVYGLLLAAGDTLFTMISGIASLWLFLLLPTYFFVVRMKGSIQMALSIWVLFSFAIALIYYLRFFQGKWKKKRLIEASQ